MSVLTMCVMDDIKMVVSGIAHQIPWADYNIKVIGTASDGAQGLEMIRELRPDIVLTDICMPKLDGCEMIQRIVEENLPTKVIFMSGFNDFAYAQTAVRLGASDYLLKPFTRTQVVKSVEKVSKVILAEREQEDRLQRLEQEVLKSKQHLRDDFLRRLLHHHAEEDVQQSWNAWGMDKLFPAFQLLVLQGEYTHSEGREEEAPSESYWNDLLKNRLEQYFSNCVQSILLYDNSERLVVLIQSQSSECGRQVWRDCSVAAAELCSFPISVGISEVHSGPDMFHKAYTEAMKALNYRFYKIEAGIFSHDELQPYGTSPRYSPELEKELMFVLRSANKERTVEKLEGVFLTWILDANQPDPMVMIQLFQTLLVAVYRTMLGLIKGEQHAELEAKMGQLQARQRLNYLDWMKDIAELCEFSCDLLHNRVQGDHAGVVERVKLYIDRHLHATLTVNSCAKEVHLSPSYLANLFKKETTMTLAAYIAQVRIEKAKEWLLEGMQVQLISERLGYEDRPYFSEMFKKHCGVTPSMYRQQYFEEASRQKR